MLIISGVVHTFLRLRSMQPGRTLNNIVYTTTNEHSMYVTYDQSEENNSKTNNHKVNNSPKTSKQRRVRTSFRPRRDTRKRGHEYQFPGRVPLKKPSGVDFLQTSHEISKFPGCTCTQRSMTREIRWRSRSSNAISYYIDILRKLFTRRPDLRSTPIIPLQNDYQYPGFTSLVPVSTSLGRE